MADGQARGAARKAAIGQQRAGFAQALGLDVAGGVQHLLHAGAALGAFVAHDDHIARLDLVGQDVGHGFVLRLDHMGGAFKHQQAVVHACGLDHAAVDGDVAGQHSQAAFLGESVLVGADAAFGAVFVQAGPAGALAEGHLRGDASGAGHVEGLDGVGRVALDVPRVQRFLERFGVHGGHIGVQLARTVQLAQDAVDAACAVHVFDVVLVGVGRHLAQLGHIARDAVNVGHGEVDLGFLRNGQDVQDGVGGAAHGDVQRHGVLKGLEAHGARQHGGVFFFVVALAQLHRQAASALEELLAVGVRGHHGTVAGQRQAQGFGQAVHRVGGEHARAGTAGGAGRTLDLGHVGIAHLVVGGHHHGVDQVELFEFDFLCLWVGQLDLASLHGATRDEHHGDVQPHGSHQHAGGDLVAVGDAHHGIGAVRVDHVFHRVGNDVAAGQRVQHAVVAHRNAIVHGDGVELFGHTARRLDLTRHQLAQVLEVHVAWHKLRERVDHRNDRLAEVVVLHAGGTPQRAGTSHVATSGRGFGAVNGHRDVG